MPSERSDLDPLADPAYHAGRSPRAGRNRLESALKPWLVEPLEGGGAHLTCPHCKNITGVVLEAWVSCKPEFVGRPCTHCFGTAKIPEEYRVHTHQHPTP